MSGHKFCEHMQKSMNGAILAMLLAIISSMGGGGGGGFPVQEYPR